ncbi:MAG TPA: aspartate--tRNA ligase [Desulfobacteraceae bacterium]|nr:aspartate--tRNA ligase [Desulfobacteraceae bacterium]
MIEGMKGWKRTHDCGSLCREHEGMDVVLMGWVERRRDLGKLIFVDLRDREGITQVVFDPTVSEDAHKKAHGLRDEWVIAIRGKVALRLKGQENPNLPTGQIEVKAEQLRILNSSDIPPFQIHGKIDASETLRLRYRYLELRRRQVFEKIRMRHRIALTVRNFLSEKGLIEVETPFLTKSTPEGARDYLVPSRVSKGKFYALPQSPQLFKQLLMIGGCDRYFQIVRCFRDEDLRADRQPEFTQIDMEMSFVEESDIMEVVEEMIHHLFREVLDIEISIPFPKISYMDAMERFGTDKPDTRFGIEIKDISSIFKESEFRIFKNTIDSNGRIKAIKVEDGGNRFSRKDIEMLESEVKENGAKGLFWIKIQEDRWSSPITKYINEREKEELGKEMDLHLGDLILIVADKKEVSEAALGNLRLKVAEKMELLNKNRFSFLWITHFPLFQYNLEEKRIDSMHHPFTSPKDEDMHLLDKDPLRVGAKAYDLILNGHEIGGGSIRIHRMDLQQKIFRILGIDQSEAELKFGFFLEALRYGAPPHGGIALGFDRLVAIITGADSIREVIPFPKTQTATCPVTGAPAEIEDAQLHDLHIQVIK